MPVEDLRQSEMMSHLLEALDKGEDIGHYGRLTFAMVAHHFLDNEELVEWLSKDGDTDESEARALVQQVEERDYNPPRRERILEWQNQQDFPIWSESRRSGCLQRVHGVGSPRRDLREHPGLPRRQGLLGGLTRTT